MQEYRFIIEQIKSEAIKQKREIKHRSSPKVYPKTRGKVITRRVI